ncbi:MAG: dihydrolipoamide acetyltransferase family protein [Bacteroidota bacterium]|nr:dihydrolipoamide acetyltransferase family protein [Bacteroidota bacterium]
MGKIEVHLPPMGEGIIEADITKWLKKEGDKVEEDESIVEVATDKVDSEIPSPADGILSNVLFNEGDTPKVGDVIAIIITQGEDLNEKGNTKTQEPAKPEIKTFSAPQIVSVIKDDKEEDSPNTYGSRTPSGKFLSPLVRNIANTENISLTELDGISGSGQEGRITKGDVITYIENRKKSKIGVRVTKLPDAPVSSGESLMKSEPYPVKSDHLTSGEGDQIIEMGRMRKLIAGHMLKSVQTSPHVTSFVEVDISDLVKWRNNNKDGFLKREGEKITYTPIFIEAVSRALRDFPYINISVDGTKIIVKRSINVGMATALPNGNLIVPVIKNADRMNLVGLARSVNDLATRARKGKLLPDEIQGGTFTITNFGSFDNITGTPIINQPEVAILGIGAIKKKPAVVETPKGDFIGIRNIMILSLSYDHRVVDGALGGQFLKRVGDYLENWNMDRKA